MIATRAAILTSALSLVLTVADPVQAERGSFAVRAQRILPVSAELPWVIERGVMIVRAGRIVAIGPDLEIPPDLEVVEFPYGTIIPGLVAGASRLGGAHRGDESIAAGYRASDAFNRYGDFTRTLAAGVTAVHLNPGTHRLLTGQGAVVRLGGVPAERVLQSAADVTVNLGVPRPPLDVTYSFPASADVAIPLPVRQRPASRPGHFLALDEAIRDAQQLEPADPFDLHRQALARAWKARQPWRVGAQRAAELRGAVEFLRQHERRGYLVGGAEADQVAGLLADAGIPVVLEPQDRFAAAGGDLGTDPAALDMSRIDFPALQKVTIAIAPPAAGSVGDLRLVAMRACQAGLGPRRALEAITRVPAEILGVAERIGSLEPDKDADFLVLTGMPLDVSTHVARTYIRGECVFAPPDTEALVIKAGTVWAKPGLQIPDGEILVEAGKIVAVGRGVPHPPFARVIDVRPHGFVTPGLIDGHGHLGLDGDRTTVDNGLRLSELVGAADVTDLRVAGAGITTVLTAPYGVASQGSPFAAIKTAGAVRSARTLGDPAAVLFDMSGSDPLAIAETLAKPLAAGQKYLDAWTKYEKELKEFLEKQAKGEQSEADQKQEEETKEVKGPDPLTGVWELIVRGTPIGDEVTLTIEMQLINASVEGRISSSSVGMTGTLSGTLIGKHLSVTARLDHPQAPGPVQIEADLVDEDRLQGTASAEGLSFPLEGRRIDKRPVEIKVTRRRTRGKDGRPLPPKVNPALEPLKALLEKKIPAVVKVSTPAQIREVLQLLVDKHELPVTLLDAEGAAVHAERLIEEKVAVIVPSRVLRSRRYQDYHQADDLARQGVSIVFQSDAEDGARHLPAVVLYAVQRGLDPEKALAALTIEAARAFRVDDRVGSLEPGKDADIVVFSGHPFQEAGQVLEVIVNGREVRP